MGRVADLGLLVSEKGVCGPLGLIREFEESSLSLRAALELKQPCRCPLRLRDHFRERVGFPGGFAGGKPCT